MKPEFFHSKSVQEVIRIHDNLIKEFGGRGGILNIGLLESAVTHPFNIWLYGNENDRKVYNLAAAYFYNIIRMNRPIVDL